MAVPLSFVDKKNGICISSGIARHFAAHGGLCLSRPTAALKGERGMGGLLAMIPTFAAKSCKSRGGLGCRPQNLQTGHTAPPLAMPLCISPLMLLHPIVQINKKKLPYKVPPSAMLFSSMHQCFFS